MYIVIVIVAYHDLRGRLFGYLGEIFGKHLILMDPVLDFFFHADILSELLHEKVL